MKNRYIVLIILGLHTLAFSTLVLSAEPTDQELDLLAHRYLNDIYGYSSFHCHDGYCYGRAVNMSQDSRYYGWLETVKVEMNTAKEIVKSALRQHNLLDDLAEIETSPELLPYLERYQSLKIRLTGRSAQPDIKMIFLEPEEMSERGVAEGACSFLGGRVLIDTSYWNRYDYLSRELLILHELAHCDLDRNHYDYSSNGITFPFDYNPDDLNFLSVMNQSLDAIVAGKYRHSEHRPQFNRRYVEDNLEQLYTELFSIDNFYRYDGTHYGDLHDEEYEEKNFVEVEDLSGFTAGVNRVILKYKQDIQQLAQQQNRSIVSINR